MRYAVVVIGGGMVGTALAGLLAQAGQRVALVEAQPPQGFDPHAGPDLRVSAISPASERLLDLLGAWEQIAATRVSPYREMHVWESPGKHGARGGAIHFDCADIGAPLLGHIVENRLVQSALQASAQRLGVEVYAPAELAALEPASDQARVRLVDGRSLDAALVVGADGAGSRTRELAGIETRGWSYAQRALVTVVETTRSHRETAWQRFMADGPLAFLPLADGRCSIVWSMRPERAAEMLELDDVALSEEITRGSDGVLGTVRVAGRRGAFPLELAHARQYTQPRLALVGDAAHNVHPLAGQGVNLGFLDAATLAEVVLAAIDAGRDPGDLQALRRYERWRKSENLKMMSALDGLHRLFGSRNPILTRARGLGLSVCDSMPGLKDMFVRHAMGLAGDVPELLRARSE